MRVEDLGFRVEGLGVRFKFQGLGFRVEDLGSGVTPVAVEVHHSEVHASASKGEVVSAADSIAVGARNTGVPRSSETASS